MKNEKKKTGQKNDGDEETHKNTTDAPFGQCCERFKMGSKILI